MKKRLLPLLIISIISVYLVSCGSFKDPEFKRIENLKFGEIGFKESTLNLDILYFNPNKTKLKLKNAEGEAWIENNYLGHFTIDTLINIPANGEFRLPIKLQVDMSKILKSSMLALLTAEILIKVTGKAKVGKGFVYINYPINYEGKQNIRELIM